MTTYGEIVPAISLCSADELEGRGLAYIIEAVSFSAAEVLGASQGLINEAVSETQADRLKANPVIENLPTLPMVVLCVKDLESIMVSIELEDFVLYAADDWGVAANV